MKKFLTLTLVAGILCLSGLGCNKDTGKAGTTVKSETKTNTPKS